MQNLIIDDFTRPLIAQNKKHQPIGSDNVFGRPIFLVEEKKAQDFDIQIVKIQHTKTQSWFCVQVPNYYTGRRHHLRLPLKTLKQCKEFVDLVFENVNAQHWSGIIVATTKKFFEDRKA